MDAPASSTRDRRSACARWRRRIALLWACVLLVVGAISGVREVGRSLFVPDRDGRDLRGRWSHVADPPAARLERAFGATMGKIVSALLPAPPRECWVRPRLRPDDEHTTLIDLQMARSLHHVFFPSQFDPLPPDVVPSAAEGRWVLDVDPKAPLALPEGFVRVAASRHFTLWRPAGSTR
jgi:hypothetical protein